MTLEESGKLKNLSWCIKADGIFESMNIQLINEVLNQEYYLNDRRFICGYITLVTVKEDGDKILEPYFVIKIMNKTFDLLDSKTRDLLLTDVAGFYSRTGVHDYYVILKRRLIV